MDPDGMMINEPVTSALLVIRDDDKKIRVQELSGRKRWSFGRRTSTVHPDISVNSAIVSRDHGEFICMDGQWFYIDHGGKNGTFINGEKIPAVRGKRRYPTLLNDADILRVDHADLSDPDQRGIYIMFLTRSINDKDEAVKLFTDKIASDSESHKV